MARTPCFRASFDNDEAATAPRTASCQNGNDHAQVEEEMTCREPVPNGKNKKQYIVEDNQQNTDQGQ
jgi:hypothetical protein